MIDPKTKLMLFVLWTAEQEPAHFKICTPIPPDIRAMCEQWEREGYSVPDDDVLDATIREMVGKLMIEVLPGGFDFGVN